MDKEEIIKRLVRAVNKADYELHRTAGQDNTSYVVDCLLPALTNEDLEVVEVTCDECGGKGYYLIDGEPQTCICIGEQFPAPKTQEEVDALCLRGTQWCHICTDANCGDNTNPECKEAKKKAKEERLK